MAGVPCSYVMRLRDIKRTSGVLCLLTSIVPHTYVKTEIAPPYLALRKFTELLILIVSLAAHFLFHRFFCTSGVLCCSSVSSLFLLLVNIL